MNPLPAMAAALTALTGYLWVAFYVWHVLPDARTEWWAFPAVATTAILGIAVMFAAIVLVVWLEERE